LVDFVALFTKREDPPSFRVYGGVKPNQPLLGFMGGRKLRDGWVRGKRGLGEAKDLPKLGQPKGGDKSPNFKILCFTSTQF
jgi:hypothetical protein